MHTEGSGPTTTPKRVILQSAQGAVKSASVVAAHGTCVHAAVHHTRGSPWHSYITRQCATLVIAAIDIVIKIVGRVVVKPLG